MKDTQLECPCGRTVVFKLENGIITYKHEDDDTSCEILNRFYKDKCADYAWQRAWLAIKTRDAKSFNVYMCIESESVMEKLWAKLSLMDADERSSFFSFLMEDDGIRHDIGQRLKDEIIKEFGADMLPAQVKAPNSDF